MSHKKGKLDCCVVVAGDCEVSHKKGKLDCCVVVAGDCEVTHKKGKLDCCVVAGDCEVSHKEGKLDCIACRYDKCRQFFPAPERMKDMLKLKHIYRTKKWITKAIKQSKPDDVEPSTKMEEPLPSVTGNAPLCQFLWDCGMRCLLH